MKKQKSKKKSNVVTILITIGIMSLIIVLMYTFDSKIKSSILKRNLKNYEWINNHVTLTTNNNFSKKVMSVEKSDAINIYNSLYQKAI